MIKFILNSEVISTSAHAGITLLDFIREQQQLKGTKIGCREGDCGACTVLIGELNEDKVTYQSITSCISPLGNAYGKHIVTVEGVNLSKKLNVAQQCLTENYGTQCGFCTPGFVVSLTGVTLKDKVSKSTCIDAISGNICRCTGYKSIEKAADSVAKILEKADSTHKLDWLIDNEFIPSYFKGISKMLKDLVTEGRSLSEGIERSRNEVEVNRSDKKFIKGRIVANGTDLYVQDADNLAEDEVRLIGGNPILRWIQFEDNEISFGANTTVTDMLENEQMNFLFPKLKAFLKLVSSEQIRNMGTLGGNFVNASPIGDMSIFFLGLNSRLSIQQADGIIRKIPFKNFHQNYKQFDLKEGELVHSISFPISKNSFQFNFEKVSKRKYLDIASVNSAMRIEVENDVISDAHISIGGVAAIPKYLEKTSAHLIGKKINENLVKQSIDILNSEILPISDIRGAADYKRLLARQLFIAHFVELFPNQVSFQNVLTE